MNNEFISTIEEIIEDQRLGKMVIMVDDEDRENEGDLIIPAAKVDDKAINFMAKHGRGLICLSLTESRVKELDLLLCLRIMMLVTLLLLQYQLRQKKVSQRVFLHKIELSQFKLLLTKKI